MNKQQAVSEYLMEIVEHFDERYGGLGEEIREFFSSSEDIKKAVKEAFYKQNGEILSYVENAPEELYEKAKELHQEFFVDSSTIRIDLEREFLFNLAVRLEAFPNEFVEELVKDGTLQKVFANSKEAFMSELIEHLQEIVLDNIHTFLSALYHDYIPEGISEEASEAIKERLGDGIFIPVSTFLSMYEDSDEDCVEE